MSKESNCEGKEGKAGIWQFPTVLRLVGKLVLITDITKMWWEIPLCCPSVKRFWIPGVFTENNSIYFVWQTSLKILFAKCLTSHIKGKKTTAAAENLRTNLL